MTRQEEWERACSGDQATLDRITALRDELLVKQQQLREDVATAERTLARLKEESKRNDVEGMAVQETLTILERKQRQ